MSDEETKSVNEAELKQELLETADDFANQVQQQVEELLNEMFVGPVDEMAFNSSMALVCGHMAVKLAAFSLALSDYYGASKSGKSMEERSEMMQKDIIGLAREARGQIDGNPVSKTLN